MKTELQPATGRRASARASRGVVGAVLGLAACATSCAMPMDEPPPRPRPIDACPAGGTLRVQVWDVYAAPRRPDGDVWDGVSASRSRSRDRVRHAHLEAHAMLVDHFNDVVIDRTSVAGASDAH